MASSGLGPQNFKGGYQAVAPEYRVEPRHSGIRISAFRIPYRHHLQISSRTAQPLVEPLVGAAHPAASRVEPFVLVLGFAQGLLITARWQALAAAFAAYIQIKKCFGPGLHLDGELGAMGANACRLRVKIQARFPLHFVEPAVTEEHARPLHLRLLSLASFFTLCPSHFEDIHEISVEFVRQNEADHARGEIHNSQSLVTDAFPNKFRPEKVNAAARKIDLAFGGKIEIRQVYREKRVLVFDRGTEEFEALVLKAQDQFGEISGLFMIQPVSQVRPREDVAMRVEHSAGIAILEYPGPAVC